MLKCSPEAPGAGYVMAEIAEAVGLPPGVLNVVTAERGASERLVSHPGVDKISFTGSLAAGRRIAGIAAERIARVTLELGGKSAGLVLDDYNIDVAPQSIAGYACLLTGQVCSSLTRIIFTRGRHDELVDALRSAFAKVTIGDPFDEATVMGRSPPNVSWRRSSTTSTVVSKTARSSPSAGAVPREGRGAGSSSRRYCLMWTIKRPLPERRSSVRY